MSSNHSKHTMQNKQKIKITFFFKLWKPPQAVTGVSRAGCMSELRSVSLVEPRESNLEAINNLLVVINIVKKLNSVSTP